MLASRRGAVRSVVLAAACVDQARAWAPAGASIASSRLTPIPHARALEHRSRRGAAASLAHMCARAQPTKPGGIADRALGAVASVAISLAVLSIAVVSERATVVSAILYLHG